MHKKHVRMTEQGRDSGREAGRQGARQGGRRREGDGGRSRNYGFNEFMARLGFIMPANDAQS